MEKELYKVIYKINPIESNLKILDGVFVKNNKNKARLLIKNKKYKLKEFIPHNNDKQEKIKIIIILSKTLVKKNNMFKNCESLLELSICNSMITNDQIDISNNEECDIRLNKDNIINEMYHSWLKNLREYKILNQHEISPIEENDLIIKKQLNISKNQRFIKGNYIILDEMFYNCKSLKSLPDISEWNTSEVHDMSNLFYNCSSLLSLPDISKWNTNNVNNMN